MYCTIDRIPLLKALWWLAQLSLVFDFLSSLDLLGFVIALHSRFSYAQNKTSAPVLLSYHIRFLVHQSFCNSIGQVNMFWSGVIGREEDPDRIYVLFYLTQKLHAFNTSR